MNTGASEGVFSDSDLFNRQILIDRLMGDEELADSVISGFLDDIPKQIAALKKFVEHGHAKRAGAQGHRIKGAAGNIGSQALQEVAYALENAGRAKDSAQLNDLMLQLESRFKELKTFMEA